MRFLYFQWWFLLFQWGFPWFQGIVLPLQRDSFNIQWYKSNFRSNLLFVVVLVTENKNSGPCRESTESNGPLVFDIWTWPTFRLQKVMAKFAGLISLITLAHSVLLMQHSNCTVHMGIHTNAMLFAWKWCRLRCCIRFGIHVQWIHNV